MKEAEWLTCEDPELMKKALPSGNSRKRRLFACACCRRAWGLLSVESRRELEMAEALADGTVKRKQLEPIQEAATQAHHTAENRTRFERLQRHTAWMACRHASGSEIIRGAFTSATMAAELLAAAALGPPPHDGMGPPDEESQAWDERYRAGQKSERQWQAAVLRDLFGNPFRPVILDPSWLTPAVRQLAQAAYDERLLPSGELDPARLEVLADALEEAACQNPEILEHCRGKGPHVRGCFVVDLILSQVR
jgi:hypothetical protein